MKVSIPNINRTYRIQGYLSILPPILIILIIKGYPTLVAILKSFTNWDGFLRSDFVGLKNYITLLRTDGLFWTLLRNNVVLLLFIPFQLLIGGIVALYLYEEFPGWKAFRTLFYLPQIISTVVVGYLFSVFFGYKGPVNQLLRSVGLSKLALNWFGNWYSAMAIIIFCLIWINIGWQGILFLSGMSSISPSILEAAEIDGAGYWKKLFLVIFPMLVRTIEYSSVISVMWVFTGLFSIIYSMTNGGPGYDTTTIDYMIYLRAFSTGGNLGAACAVAVVLFLIIMLLTIIQVNLADKSDDWSE